LVGIAGRLLSFLYGVGAALTLDELALWLNLEDVYWGRQGRESIDAIILFGTLLLIAIWRSGFSKQWRKSCEEKKLIQRPAPAVLSFVGARG
jgi:hypothetical protein